MLHLQAACQYEMDSLTEMQTTVNQCLADDPDTIVAQGCVLFKEGKFEAALGKFAEANNAMGYQPDLAYNMAICCYRLQEYNAALKHIMRIIEYGVTQHPELCIGAQSDDIETHSVGNSKLLQETALVQAFNLKAAVEFQLKNNEAAVRALQEMPPRSEDELDAVTLHNQGLLNMESNPTEGFKKLNFLISQPSFPPETFGNLLLLYIKYQYYAVAADVLAENVHLHESCLSQELYEYIEATILTQSSPAEAYRKFEQLSKKHVEGLRKLTKNIQDARLSRDNARIDEALQEYDESLERYIPVLMGQAKIYWDIKNYDMVERIFKQSVEFCEEHEAWKMNVAHVFFMQENKFREAIHYYQPLVQDKIQHASILDVQAIMLANLCVAYIMTGQNEIAEEVMRQIEKEEERVSLEDEDSKPSYHLCIVNLVIGTLYCSKGNYEFGVQCIIKSLDPLSKKLEYDTWYHAKRCLLAVVEQLAKHSLVFNDEFYDKLLDFLVDVEEHGKGKLNRLAGDQDEATVTADGAEECDDRNGGSSPASSVASPRSPTSKRDESITDVAQEARLIRHLVLRLLE
jgi:tetratricopeptide repeat protein 30